MIVDVVAGNVCQNDIFGLAYEEPGRAQETNKLAASRNIESTLEMCLRENLVPSSRQHTAFLWSGGPLIQRGQYHRVTYMCAQRMVKRDMIYHSPVMQCMSKYMCCMTCLPCSNNDLFHGIVLYIRCVCHDQSIDPYTHTHSF